MCKSIALKLSARCVPPRGAAQHQPRGCAAHSSSSVRTTRLITRLITRLLLRFELPGGYFGTTRPIIRLVVDPIIRVVLYYQPKADNPADNPAVSFVVYLKKSYNGPLWLNLVGSWVPRTSPHLGILSGRLRCSRSPVSGHGHRRTLFCPVFPHFLLTCLKRACALWGK